MKLNVLTVIANRKYSYGITRWKLADAGYAQTVTVGTLLLLESDMRQRNRESFLIQYIRSYRSIKAIQSDPNHAGHTSSVLSARLLAAWFGPVMVSVI